MIEDGVYLPRNRLEEVDLTKIHNTTTNSCFDLYVKCTVNFDPHRLPTGSILHVSGDAIYAGFAVSFVRNCT